MHKSYSGKVLVAHPNTKDPIFQKTVVYICCDNENEGTIGLILNKPTNSNLQMFFESLDLNFHGRDIFFYGGPINNKSMILLHTDDWSSTSTMSVENRLLMTSDLDMLEKFDLGDEPKHWKMFRGISYWMPGQLANEVNSSTGWQVLDVKKDTKSLMFNYSNTAMWNEALMHCSRNFVDQFA